MPDRYAGLDLVVGKITTFGGRLEELAATGIVAAFGLDPVEDAPRRAAHAAMAILRATQRARAEGEAVDIRLAIHVGEVVVGQASGTAEMALESKQESWALLGALVAQAEPNSIVVSEAAVPFLEPRFDLLPGEAGPALPGRTYRLVGLEPSALEPRRRLARFVGRGRELELIQSQFAAAGRGHGQVVGIVGEAGIGKTRLVVEFRQLLGPEGICLEAHCLSYGTAIPHLPLLDIVRSACGLLDGDSPEVLAGKVRERLRTLGLEPGDGAAYLLQLLGVKTDADRFDALSPEAVQARTFETLRQLTLRASRRQPLALVVENLHWIDRASEEYLASLVDAVPGANVLLLFTYRPGYRPPWSDKSYATQIALQPLAPRDSLALVRSVVPAETVSDPLVEAILARAEGNPFFLEELVLVVAERTGDSATPAVPATVQDVLLARISRLSEEAKWALQTAAVLGREVPLDLLRAIWTGPGPLEPQLRELTRLEFLHGHGGLEEPVYAFKHALTREVAYESLMPSRRRELHAAAGEALERLYAGRLEEIADRLAHHYARAARPSKAVAYLVRVAERAARTYAHVEAAAVLREALQQAERLPDEEREGQLTALSLRLAHSLYFLGQFPEALALLLGGASRPRDSPIRPRPRPGTSGSATCGATWATTSGPTRRPARRSPRPSARTTRSSSVRRTTSCPAAGSGPGGSPRASSTGGGRSRCSSGPRRAGGSAPPTGAWRSTTASWASSSAGSRPRARPSGRRGDRGPAAPGLCRLDDRLARGGAGPRGDRRRGVPAQSRALAGSGEHHGCPELPRRGVPRAGRLPPGDPAPRGRGGALDPLPAPADAGLVHGGARRGVPRGG